MKNADMRSQSVAHTPALRGFGYSSCHHSGSWFSVTITMPTANPIGKSVSPSGRKRPSRSGTRPKARQLDQYYTQSKIAERLYRLFCRHFDPAKFQMVEPGAGRGAFYRLLPTGSFGCDVEPMMAGIVTADFLTLSINSGKRVAIIGNPPFGKNASLAVSFFNHWASNADVIAFIVPKTFRKTSIINKLDDSFHLLHEEPVPDNAFLFQGKPRTVPAVFQIWVRRDESRARLPEERTHRDFEFTTWDLADIAIQRVGKDAGRVHKNFSLSPKAHYFIRGKVEAAMRSLQPAFAEAAQNTAGNPSLAMTEIVALYRARRSGGSFPPKVACGADHPRIEDDGDV